MRDQWSVRCGAFLVAVATSLVLAAPALAGGGNYVVDGGTPVERAQVTAALDASSFPWSVVPQQISIHVARGIDSFGLKGAIWLDADLLDSGAFAWGTIQHEYAHQLDFFMLDDMQRAALQSRLGGSSWWQTSAELQHGDLASERFASTLAWAYWPSAQNSMRPAGQNDESAALPPAEFRAQLAAALGRPELAAAPTRSLASVKPTASHRVVAHANHTNA